MFTTNSYRVARLVAATIGLSVVALLSSVVAQEQQPPTPQASPEHLVLQKDVGTWDAEITLFPPAPGVAPMKSKGREKCELLPGGMWLISRFEGDMMGTKFSGAGTTGYDPVEKKYVGTWVDSMSPHMMQLKGEYDAAKSTMTTIGEGLDPATGAKYTAKLISRYLDDNNRTFEMHMPGPDGKQMKMMEIKYQRHVD